MIFPLPVEVVGIRVEVGFCWTKNWKLHHCWLRLTWPGRKWFAGTALVRRTEVDRSTRTERVLVWLVLRRTVMRCWPIVLLLSFVLLPVCRLCPDSLRQRLQIKKYKKYHQIKYSIGFFFLIIFLKSYKKILQKTQPMLLVQLPKFVRFPMWWKGSFLRNPRNRSINILPNLVGVLQLVVEFRHLGHTDMDMVVDKRDIESIRSSTG